MPGLKRWTTKHGVKKILCGSPQTVCLTCRKKAENPCQWCGSRTFGVGIDFRTPKKTDRKAWEIVEILCRGGFNFSEFDGSYDRRTRYPKTAEAARKLVEKENTWFNRWSKVIKSL